MRHGEQVQSLRRHHSPGSDMILRNAWLNLAPHVYLLLHLVLALLTGVFFKFSALFSHVI